MEQSKLQKERETFLDYWCEDVPEYMRAKWRESVSELLDTPNSAEKMQAAWEAWQARGKLDAPTQSDPVPNYAPSAWVVYWGLGNMRKDSVHLEKQAAQEVASCIRSNTEVRPLFEHFPKQEAVGIVMIKNGVKTPALFTDSDHTLQACDFLYAQPVADKQDASRYRAFRKLMERPVDEWPGGVSLARTPEALDAALDVGLECK